MHTVYIETSIVSYLRQEPSSQIVAAARQLLTRRWWEHERRGYELVVSQYVIDEASAGDPRLAAQRLQLLAGIPLLPDAPWNCSHIANARIVPHVYRLLSRRGLPSSLICTPEELMDEGPE